LEVWTGKAALRQKGDSIDNMNDAQLAEIGKGLLSQSEDKVSGLEVLGENMEKSKRRTVILGVFNSYRAYGQMLHYYSVKNLMEYMNADTGATLASMAKALAGNREQKWDNIGGQLIPSASVDAIRSDIGSGKLASWEDIHRRYDGLWEEYTVEKQRHAFSTLCEILGKGSITSEDWVIALNKAVEIQEFICEQVYITRKKDFDNPYRQATYRNIEEMTAAIGTIEDNSFVKQIRSETEVFKESVEKIKQ
jgi:hypothetical protein